MVVDKSSNLIKIITISIVGQKTSYDVRKPIDNVFVNDTLPSPLLNPLEGPTM